MPSTILSLFDLFLAFSTLAILEIVLGIDNVVFLSIISQRLPPDQRKKARQLGLTLAWVLRLILLSLTFWLIHVTKPLFSIFDMTFSINSIIFLLGGLFLIVKATLEIHSELDRVQSRARKHKFKAKFGLIVTQIAIFNLIFSIDSVLTAIGLTQNFWLMTSAITVAILMMLFASEVLSKLIEKHPTIKILALSFLYLIGLALIAEAFSFYIPRGYIYFAIGFSIFVEFLNLINTKRKQTSIKAKG